MEPKALFEALNLSNLDICLIILSPLCAIFGSLAHFCIIEIDPNRPPRPGTTVILKTIDALGRIKWLSMRLFIGGLLGLLFTFYFVGTLSQTSTSLFKLLAFAILIGFSAPRLWCLQEKILMEQIDLRIRKAINATIPQNTQQNASTDGQSLPSEPMR